MARGLVEAIRASSALLDALPDGILVADRQGTILYSSTQLQNLSGYSSNELQGKPLETLVPERFHSVHVQHRAGYVATGLPIRAMGTGLKIYLRTRNGREVECK